MLTALYNNGDVDINNLLEETNFLEHRYFFDLHTDLTSEFLTLPEVYAYRPKYIECLLSKHKHDRPLFIKTHELFHKAKSTYITKANTQAIIYVIRNPMAVACSLAKYNAVSKDRAIQSLNNNDTELKGRPIDILFPRPIGNWSNHVLGWVNNTTIKPEVVRYEDMKSKPEETFTKVFNNIGLDLPQELIYKSIKATEFDALKNQELTKGYQGTPIRSQSFFRKGETDGWRKELSQQQQDNIINKHKDVMIQFGYL